VRRVCPLLVVRLTSHEKRKRDFFDEKACSWKQYGGELKKIHADDCPLLTPRTTVSFVRNETTLDVLEKIKESHHRLQGTQITHDTRNKTRAGERSKTKGIRVPRTSRNPSAGAPLISALVCRPAHERQTRNERRCEETETHDHTAEFPQGKATTHAT